MGNLVLFSSLVAAMLCLAGCGGSGPSSAASAPGAAVTARVAVVAASATPNVREAVGTIRSLTTSAIQSKTVGHVMAVHAKAGDMVEAGALLAEIDPRDADSQLKSANSGLQVAQRGLEEAAKGVAAAQSAARAAEAQRDLAKTTFDRQTKLLAEKAISKQMFDEAEAAAKSAEAEAHMRADEVAAVLARREQAMAAVEQAKAALDAATTGVSYTKVTAPYAGIVTSKTVDVGDLASPGMTLFSLEDRQRYRLEANVDESTVAAVRAGDAVKVVVDGIADDSLEGTVSEIVPAADPASRTSIVKIDLPPNDALRSGQFGRARFASGESSSLAVPRTALVLRGQLEGVYAVDDEGVVRLRLIKTGKPLGDSVEVLSGLNEGDRYVAEVTPDVVDGVRVAAR